MLYKRSPVLQLQVAVDLSFLSDLRMRRRWRSRKQKNRVTCDFGRTRLDSGCRSVHGSWRSGHIFVDYQKGTIGGVEWAGHMPEGDQPVAETANSSEEAWGTDGFLNIRPSEFETLEAYKPLEPLQRTFFETHCGAAVMARTSIKHSETLVEARTAYPPALVKHP